MCLYGNLDFQHFDPSKGLKGINILSPALPVVNLEIILAANLLRQTSVQGSRQMKEDQRLK